MDNTMLVGLTRQLTLRRAMDVAANNIANADTTGFKVERLMLEADPTNKTQHLDGPRTVAFVDEWAMGRDYSQGSLEFTERSLDLALQGEGFFMIEGAGGERFTRDGSFTLNEMGELVTSSGDRVLDDIGQPIFLNPEGGRVEIAQNGQIFQDGLPMQRVGVARFEQLGVLQKVGENQYTAPADAERLLDGMPLVAQGYLERSNVRPIVEITRMMEVSRAYSSVTRMIRDTDELARKAIERLGRA